MAHSIKNSSLSDQESLDMMRALRRKRLAEGPKSPDDCSLGERVADQVAGVVGSWRFIIVQSAFLAVWIVLNSVALLRHWDPYPFILMNLALSFQAAYTAPMIMMSQNRQAAIDRRNAAYDFEVNLKAEHEIKALHAKINLLQEQLERLRTQDVAELVQLLRGLEVKLEPEGKPDLRHRD